MEECCVNGPSVEADRGVPRNLGRTMPLTIPTVNSTGHRIQIGSKERVTIQVPIFIFGVVLLRWGGLTEYVMNTDPIGILSP